MEHFYVTLHSDGSKDIFPGNTTASFKTRLATPISLVGEWDVALYEIHYKRLWYTINAIDAEITYEVKPSEGEASIYRVFLYQGYYPTIDEVVQALNNIFLILKNTQKLDRAPIFGYNGRMRKIFIDLQQDGSLTFKPKLATMLGITTNPIHYTVESKRYYSDELVNIDGTIHTLYVYCNIIEKMPFGGVEAPLLRIVGIDARQREIIRKTYDNPMYVPVRIKKFYTIEIDIKSNTGEHVPFQYSKSEVILHFRKQPSQTLSHFYVTLPSNSSMSYYPDNTVTRYKTRLSQPISLDGEWEVGLFEFEYQRTWYNVEEKDSTIRFDHMKNGKTVRDKVHIPHGYYTNIEELTDRINTSFVVFGVENGIATMPQLRVDKLTRKISIHTSDGMRIFVSVGLGNILGYDEREDVINVYGIPDTVLTLHNTYNTEVNCQSLFVYCDILERVFVGNTKAPLLRTISVSGKHGNIVREKFDKPMYVPIQQKHFETIEVDIRNDFGEPVSFVNGKSSVTLHLRMSKNPYFLQ